MTTTSQNAALFEFLSFPKEKKKEFYDSLCKHYLDHVHYYFKIKISLDILKMLRFRDGVLEMLIVMFSIYWGFFI